MRIVARRDSLCGVRKPPLQHSKRRCTPRIPFQAQHAKLNPLRKGGPSGLTQQDAMRPFAILSQSLAQGRSFGTYPTERCARDRESQSLAQGRSFGTYIASGKYLQRMSNYCAGCRYKPDRATGDDACPFTTLYWDFLLRHEAAFANHPRLGQQIRNLRHLSEADKQAIRQQATILRQKKSSA